MHANIDLVFLCEMWLRPEGDESDCVALTPPTFCLRSFPRMSGAGGGLAALYHNNLTKNIAVSTRDFVFTTFEICEVRISFDSHTVVFLSAYRPPSPLPPTQSKEQTDKCNVLGTVYLSPRIICCL